MGRHPLPLAALLLLSGCASADGAGSVYSGITHTGNLEVQASGNQGGTARSGLETGITYSHQSLGYTGGYTLDGSADLNKGLAGGRDITSVRATAHKLSAFSPEWLLRVGGQGEQYKNDGLPANSYQGLGAEATLGHLGAAGGGTDITLSFKRERHGQVASDPYSVGRGVLTLVKYSPHAQGQPYWGLQAAYQRNAATDNNSHSFSSALLGAQYSQWALGPFRGQAGVQWQQDTYPQVTAGQMGGAAPTQKGSTYLASASLSKPLRKGLDLQLSASVGRYASTTGIGGMATGSTVGFHSLSAGLKWGF